MPETPRTYIVKQLVSDHRGDRNEHAETLEDLVTHHPRGNRNIRMQDGQIAQSEDMLPGYRGGNRSYAFIGGEFQEVIDAQSDRYRNLGPDQVLMSKDFILEDPRPPAGQSARAVDVPSPIDGYVNAVNRNAGFVEIMDRQDGEVIARVRHMSGVTVEAGDTVVYGQSLGTQNNSGLNLPAGRAIHVHLDMDTRYYQQYQNYIRDLSDGRLPVQAEFREGVAARRVEDDGIARLGESSDRVRDVQTALVADGYRAVSNQPIVVDGVYRHEMQGALIAFQQDHGLLQTGDIDLATWQQARHINERAQVAQGNPRLDQMAIGNVVPGLMQQVAAEPLAPGDPRYGLRPPSDPARTGRAPQWETHADHTQARDREAPQPAPLQNPAAPRAPVPDRQLEVPAGAEQERRPEPLPGRHGAVLLDDPAHQNHAMYLAALRVVNERDAQMGRQPDEISRQLAAGLVEKARERGLDTIGAARFTPDGTKVGMTDTADLSSPWAKTAVGDVGQLAGQRLSQSSDNVADINQKQALAQSLQPPPPTPGLDGPDGPAAKGPRLA
jgi:hypothetical protein